MSNSSKAFLYDAFISYSRMDEAFAKRLESELEKYRFPRGILGDRNRLNIFRDVADLVGNELNDAIVSAIRQSRYLIVVCSPHSRKAAWVTREIEAFAKVRGRQFIVPVLVAGRPNQEVKPEDVVQDQAFGDVLYQYFQEPLAADFRTFKDEPWPKRRTRHKEAKFQVLAYLLDQPKEDLINRQRARTMKLLSWAAAGFLLAAVAFAWIAYAAVNARDEAQRQTRIANARRLAAESEVLLHKYPQSATLLAVEAVNATSKDGSPVRPAKQAVVDAMLAYSGISLCGHEGRITELTISPDGHWLVTEGVTVRLWDLTQKNPQKHVIALSGHNEVVYLIAISPNSRWLITTRLQVRVLPE